MKVFKTIIWTSIFWILVVVGLWAASFWRAEVVDFIVAGLPEPVWRNVYNQGLADGTRASDCDCPVCDSLLNTPTENTKEVTIDTENQSEISMDEADVGIGEAQNTQHQALFPSQEKTQTLETAKLENEVLVLQQKLTQLENNHWALVKELQTIFSSPAAQSLLPAPTPVAENVTPQN